MSRPRLRAVCVYLHEVRMVRRKTAERPYLVIAYGTHVIGKLAIPRRLFDRLRADGIPLLEKPPTRARSLSPHDQVGKKNC